jgi:hypothetical protein
MGIRMPCARELEVDESGFAMRLRYPAADVTFIGVASRR